VAVPQRPFAPSVVSVTSVANDKGDNEMIPSVANDKGDNEMIPGAVHRSPDICLTAEELPRNLS
jgi:hypothetical protein